MSSKKSKPWEKHPQKNIQGWKTDMKVIKGDSEEDSSKEIKESQLKEERGRRVREWWADGDRGVDYSLVLSLSFFYVGSFPLHCTLGADNRWSYHYCKTHNTHSDSLSLRCIWQHVCVCMCVHLITAHYGTKSDNNSQTAAGCSLHLHWAAVIVLIAIWTNYWRAKKNQIESLRL